MLANKGLTLASVLGMLLIPTLALVAQAQEGLRWEKSIESAKQMAAASNRLVLLHFWDEGCPPCMKLEQNVFSQPGFGQQLTAHYVAVKVKMSDHVAAVNQYKVDRMPMDVVITPRGQALFKTISPQDGQQYVGQLMQVAYNEQRKIQQAARPTETSMNVGAPQESMPPPATPSDVGAGAGYTGGPPSSVQIPSNPSPAATAPAATKSPTTDDRYADYYARRQAVQQDPIDPMPSSAPVSNYNAPPVNSAPPLANSAPPISTPPMNNSPAAPSDNRYATPGAAAPPYVAQNNPPQPPRYGEPTTTSSGIPTAQPPFTAGQPMPSAPTGTPNPYVGISTPPAQNNFAPQQPIAQQPAAPPYANQTVAGPAMQSLPPLPPGSPALGLEGFCPVTLTERRTWNKGNPQWGAIHRGRTYLFVSQVEQQKFLAAPDTYSPMLSGNDPVLQMTQNQSVPGRREHGVFYNNRIYLFATEGSLREFTQAPTRFDNMIMQAMTPQQAPR